MAIIYRIELDELDLGQLLEGLENRGESWVRTADYLLTDRMPDGEWFVIEECSDADEAEGIAKHFRSIVSKIHQQMEVQP